MKYSIETIKKNGHEIITAYSSIADNDPADKFLSAPLPFGIMDDYGCYRYEYKDGYAYEFLYQKSESEKMLDAISQMPKSEKREYLYRTLRFRFIDNVLQKGLDLDKPLCKLNGETLTCDEAKDIWIKYIGDNDIKAENALKLCIDGKKYIRMVI